MNIFVFVFGPEYKPEYICIRIRITKNILNIFVFAPKKIFASLCHRYLEYLRNLNYHRNIKFKTFKTFKIFNTFYSILKHLKAFESGSKAF